MCLMPSLLPDYEYDIFVSYRQNDNRSGWVTEFVKHLNEELATTIKQTVSVYFDPLRKVPQFAELLEKSRLIYEERLRKYAN